MNIVEKIKNKPRNYEIKDDVSWMTMERGEFLDLIAEVERLREEDCDFPHITILNENSALKAENAELKEECEKLHKYCQGRYKFDPIKNEQTIKDLKAKLAESKTNMDGVTRLDLEANWTVEMLKPEIERLEIALAESEKKVKELMPPNPYKGNTL